LYRSEWSNLNGKRRKRNLSIPATLFPILIALSRRAGFTGPDDFVLGSRGGTPINGHSIAQNRLKPIGKTLQMPWLSWQVVRRTRLTLAYEFGIQFHEALALRSR
jgi:hypothetical protein